MVSVGFSSLIVLPAFENLVNGVGKTRGGWDLQLVVQAVWVRAANEHLHLALYLYCLHLRLDRGSGDGSLIRQSDNGDRHCHLSLALQDS